MSSAPPGDHLAPVIPDLSSMTKRHAPLDHAGGGRPAGRQCLVVAHVLVVAGQVGDGLVDVGEVEVAGAGMGAGSGGGGRQRGGDRPGAAVQHPQPLPAGPLAGGGRVAGVQRGGGLAEVAGLSTGPDMP